MRIGLEIATELADAQRRLEAIGYVNVYGATLDKLAELEFRRMTLLRDIWRLRHEREEWISAPTSPDPSDHSAAPAPAQPCPPPETKA